MRWFSAILFLSLGLSLPAQAKVDRQAYIESLYRSLKPILLTYVTSLEPEKKADPENYFLIRISKMLQHNPPELVFVDKDSEAFVIEAGQDPRLMRAPDAPGTPIYLNNELLNSDNFSLDLPQILKLFIHELGHKTNLSSVKNRDLWAQHFEDRLRPFAIKTTSLDGSSKAEGLSLPNSWVDIPLAENPMEIQPSFWIYVQNNGKVVDISESLRQKIGSQLVSTRNLNVEITMVTMGIANIFTGLLGKLAQAMQTMTHMFNEPGLRPEEREEQEHPLMRNAEYPVSALNLLLLQRLTFVGNELHLDVAQQHARTHKHMHLNITGFPLSEGKDLLPIQVFVKNFDDPETLTVSTQLVPQPNFDKMAKLGRVTRNDGKLSQVEVSFQAETMPYFADLSLEVAGDSFRLRSKNLEQTKPGTFKATFFMDDFARTAISADRIILSNEEILFMDRELSVTEDSLAQADSMTTADLPADTVGIWGKVGVDDVLKKHFSHFDPPILFFLSGPENKQFVINPYNLWIQFEIRESLDVAQAELYWNAEQMIMNIDPADKNVLKVTEQRETGNVEQIYVAGDATLKERRSVFESILFEQEAMKVRNSDRPGFKTIKMKALTPMKHLRDLNSGEAHRVPTATPITLKIVTTDHKVYHHAFPIDPRFAGENAPKFNMSCEDLLKQIRK